MDSNASKDTTHKGAPLRDRLHTIADRTWTVAGWFWSVIIIAFLVSFASGLALADDIKNIIFTRGLQWLSQRQPGELFRIPIEFYRITTLIMLMLFVAVTLLSVLLRQLLKKSSTTELQEILELMKKERKMEEERDAAQKANEEEGFKQYLRFMKDMNQNINPKGLAQAWHRLVLTDVPLDAVFVPLLTIPDQPVYDMPGEQQRQLEQLQQRTDPGSQIRKNTIQRLRLTWRSQMRQEKVQTMQQVSVEEVLQRFSPADPVAVILGTPGSGKTTFLRWAAYHLADALLSSNSSSLAKGSEAKWIPILIQTNDYADRLAKEPLTLRQYLIIQLSEIHPNASAKVLDALEQGSCLVMFDGLDEGLSSPVRRHVTSAIHSFIIDHAVENPQTHQKNCFIITSRIADYEPDDFVRYAHYTLLDLNDRLIEYLLAKWCTAIEHNFIAPVPGAQHLTERDWIEVETRQQKYWHSLLKASPDLKRLAANPLMLTIIAFFQASNRGLPDHRFHLYQIVTRTLLDTWNRESGRKMFSEAQIQLVEIVLGRFAEQMQHDSRLLRRQDVETITRQAMAEFYRLQAQEIKEHDVTQFIETLRRSSGLFAQAGDDLFCFANQTFQDYFATLRFGQPSADKAPTQPLKQS